MWGHLLQMSQRVVNGLCYSHIHQALDHQALLATQLEHGQSIRDVIFSRVRLMAQVVAGGHRWSQVFADCRRSSQVVVGRHRSSQVVAGHHRLSQVVTSRRKSSQVVASHRRSSQVVAGLRKVIAGRCRWSHVVACPSQHFMAIIYVVKIS